MTQEFDLHGDMEVLGPGKKAWPIEEDHRINRSGNADWWR